MEGNKYVVVMRLSKSWRSNATKDIRLLLEKWKEFSTARPTTNSSTEILKLLEETTKIASVSSSSSSESTLKVEVVSSSRSTSMDSRNLSALNTPACILLGQPRSSALIWKTLRRHRVPWKDTCALMSLQLAVLPAHQQEYLKRRGKSRPWSFSRLVLESWEMGDPDLLGVFRLLLRCRTVVSFAQEVSAALRGRPQLHEVLPVPWNVLQHLYELGIAARPNPRESHQSRSSSSAPDDALLALNLCKQLALAGRESLSTTTRERLVMGYARLHAHSGGWEEALSIVRSSDVVRLSTKVSFARHVHRRSLSAKPDLTAREAPEAVIAAPNWRQALQVLDRFPDNDDARLDFLSRADVIAGSSQSPSWCECLSIFSKVSPAKQMYSVLRKSVLARIPHENPKFIVIMADALQHVGQRMYPGTFARRLEVLRKKGFWAEAVALACGAQCYDLASTLTPHLRTPTTYELPVDLITYEKDVLALLEARIEGRVPPRACGSNTPSNKPQVDVNQLTYPQLLARALYGDWRGILQSSAALSNSRLRSLLAAKRISEDGLNDVGAVECHVFANNDIMQLVLSCAPARDLKYFFKVIPSVTAATLRRKLAGPSLDPKAVSPLDAYRSFLGSSTKVATMEDCHAMCDLIVNYLRMHARRAPCSRETLLLRELARCCAQGRVKLTSSDTCGLALGFLKACKSLRCRPEATTACKAFVSIPSPKLDIHLPAMTVGVNALNLLGKWQAVASVYARWCRKQCEGVLPDPPSRQHVVTHPVSDEREQLVDVFARIVYYTPHHQQIEWARRIWREQRSKFNILLQELLVGDTRETSRILHATAALLGQGRNEHRSTQKRLSPRVKEALVLEKKKLLGASFCTLHTEIALRRVVRACGKERVEPHDIDEHGFQRLLKVLSGRDAAEAILSLHEENAETVEDLWLISVMASPDVSAEQLGRLRAARPYSALVSSAFIITSGLLQNNPTAALKGLLRLVMISEISDSQRSLCTAIAKLIQRMCESEEVVSALKGATNTEENQRLARAIYNRLLESSILVKSLKHDRKSLTMLLKNPEALSPLLMLGYLHHVLNRSLQHPIKASFSSHMLRMASTHTRDWMSAIYFFKCIRSPTLEERCLVVRASRGCPDATSYLVSCRRFLEGCPEQVVVWCDERINPDEKWRVSLRLFEATTRAMSLPRDPADKSTVSSEEVNHDNVSPTHWDTSESILQGLLSQWSHLDCVRALELLRRAGFVRSRPEGGEGGAKPRPPLSENFEEVADDGNEHHVVRLIKAQKQRCLKSPNSL
ncbi:unnamed protein product [Phytomonas sp. EM1]|nr:unnamed protein product [Phytomonas sp. EM1]|eukprot:CCW60759.1 unnamed protein product [Phytomonas sp. isolate EM1]